MAADAFGLIGKVLGGQFRVDDCVGEGGFSVVYKGFHMGLKEPVAIKCLRLPQLEKKELADQFAHRFRDESRIAYRLSQGNLNIVRSITSGSAQDAKGGLVPYMVLEWLAGETLGALLRRRRSQLSENERGRSVAETVLLFAPAAEALGYAHSHGVIHRDIKPQNLFLAETKDSRRLKVLDFGMAKILSDGTLGVAPLAQSISTTAPVFSPPYAAPEQFDWKVGLIGTWTDVYSFAMVFLEALSDRRVRQGESLAECMVEACDARRTVKVSEHCSHLGPALLQVLTRALSLKPKERPVDMTEFWAQVVEADRQDGPRGPAPAVGDSEDDAATAVSDTRGLFTNADLGATVPGVQPAAARQLEVKTAPKPFVPPGVDAEVTETRTFSDVRAAAMERPPPVSVSPLSQLDKTIVTAPPVHQASPMTRTLMGTGPLVAPPSAQAPPDKQGGLNKTLALGAAYPAPASRGLAPAATPAPVAAPIEEMTRARTEPAPPLSMTAADAAPPVERGPHPYESTAIVNTGTHYPDIMAGHHATAPQGAAALGTPAFGAPAYRPEATATHTATAPVAASAYGPMGAEPQPPSHRHGAPGATPLASPEPQTIGYSPVAPAPAYGPPPTGYGAEGYVNVTAPASPKRVPPLLIAAIGVVVLFVLVGIGVAAYFIAKPRYAAVPPTVIAPAAPAAPTSAGSGAAESPPAVSNAATVEPPPLPVPAEPAPTPPPALATAEPPAAPTEPPVATQPNEPAPRPVEPPRPLVPEPKRPAAPSPPRPAAPVAQRPAAPTPVAATPVAPNAFNPDAARSALRSMEGILASCKKADGPTGPGKVRVTFANSGAVQSAAMLGAPYEGTPTGECAASRFRMARVTAFEGAPGSLDYAFRINK
ncbi:MAG: protein kinase [Myxococcales bacterium]|nr:protein kinase [Myxococcales bacterium]